MIGPQSHYPYSCCPQSLCLYSCCPQSLCHQYPAVIPSDLNLSVLTPLSSNLLLVLSVSEIPHLVTPTTQEVSCTDHVMHENNVLHTMVRGMEEVSPDMAAAALLTYMVPLILVPRIQRENCNTYRLFSEGSGDTVSQPTWLVHTKRDHSYTAAL